MVKIYLLSLVPILLTEYGFQSSSMAIHHMKRRFIPARTFMRLLFWAVIAALTIRKYSLILVTPAAVFFVISELSVQVLRSSVRKDLRAELRYGSIKSHMIPFIFAGTVVPALYILLTLYLRRIGTNVDLEEAMVAELLKPYIVLYTRTILVLVVVISEWTWASLLIKSVEQTVHLYSREDVVDPVARRREVIGVMERLVTLVMVALGGHVGAGIVIAIKSTGRLPKLANRQDAEQFIVETLGSVGLATLGGLLICML